MPRPRQYVVTLGHFRLKNRNFQNFGFRPVGRVLPEWKIIDSFSMAKVSTVVSHCATTGVRCKWRSLMVMEQTNWPLMTCSWSTLVLTCSLGLELTRHLQSERIHCRTPVIIWTKRKLHGCRFRWFAKDAKVKLSIKQFEPNFKKTEMLKKKL